MKERICIRNVLKYNEYQSKNNFKTRLDEDFNVFIETGDNYVVKINRNKFLGLNDEEKMKELDKHIADCLHNNLNKNLSKTAAETALEFSISNFLDKQI